MDPNANLSEQLGCARRILAEDGAHPDDAIRLAELVEALDVWLSSGGFLPDRWQHKRSR